jgi:hypothetical protein
MGWVSANLLEVAAQNLPDPVTSQSILKGLWAMKNNDLGGITAPLTFHQGAANPQPMCYWGVQIHNGGWTTIDGGARFCD